MSMRTWIQTAVLTALTWMGLSARATEFGLKSTSGNWDTPADWSPNSGVPSTTSDNAYIGSDHPGSGTLWTGAVTMTTSHSINSFQIGYQYWNKRGTLNINGGNLTANTTCYLQGQETGTVNQISGDVTINNGDLNIAYDANSYGIWNLTSGNLSMNYLNLANGAGAGGEINWLGGGTVRVQWDANLGRGPGLTIGAGGWKQWGAYSTSNGVQRDLNIGRYGGSNSVSFTDSVFNIGNANQGGMLRLGYYENGSKGSFSVGNGQTVDIYGGHLNIAEVGNAGGRGYLGIASGGTIRVRYDVNIGAGSPVEPPAGGFKQWSPNSDTNGIQRDLNIGRWSGTNSFRVPIGELFYVGNPATGGDGATLRLGYNDQSSKGILNVPSGSIIRVNGYFEIGNGTDCHGAINCETGGQIQVRYDTHFYRDSYTPTVGMFHRWHNTNEIGIGRDLYVGRAAGTNVVFTQSDTNFYVGGSEEGGSLYLGTDANAIGTYVMSSGQVLRVRDYIRIGQNGMGTIQAAPGARIVTRNNNVYLDRTNFTPTVDCFYRNDEVTVGVQSSLQIGENSPVAQPATWTQSDTNFVIGGDLNLGYNGTRQGSYVLPSGMVCQVTSWLNMGYDGDGYLNAATGSIMKAANIRLNRNNYTPPKGTFRRSDGVTGGIQGTMYLNDSSEPGTLEWTQSDDYFQFGGNLQIGYWGSSAARYNMSAGQTNKIDGELYIGHSGVGTLNAPAGSKVITGNFSLSRSSYAPPAGVFFQSDGVTPGINSSMYIARANESDPVVFTQPDAVWTLGGELAIANDGNAANGTYLLSANRVHVPGGWVHVGRNGTGVLDMRGGQITGNNGMLIGEGDQNVKQQLLGYGTIIRYSDFYNRGQVVADGGTLSITNVNNIYCDRDCVIDANDTFLWTEQRGWFARNEGKLELRPFAVATGSNPYNWGEQNGDTSPDMVNSVRLEFNNVTTGDRMDIDLIATNSIETPTGLGNAVSIWNLRPGGNLAFTDCTIKFRYDDKLAADRGVAETSLNVFKHDGTSWLRVTSGVTFDTANHIVTITGVTGFSKWAVAGDYLFVDNASGASNVGTTTATLNGTLLADNGATTYVWVYWNTTDGGTDQASWTNSQYFGTPSLGALATNMTGLLTQQQYYYRFLASNTVAASWAPTTASFQTLGVPVVSTLSATGVTTNQATLRANFSSGGSGTVKIFWGTTDQGESYTAWDTIASFGGVSQGTWTTNVAVQAGQRYYFRAYVTNSIAEDWANTTETFLADADPEGTISSSLQNPLKNFNTAPNTVFVSDQVGYVFYIGTLGSGRVCYRKTTNGGASWGSEVDVTGGSSWANVAVWYDQWTPGDTTGTKIHLAMINEGDAELWYRSLDTASDTLSGGLVQINTAINSDYWTEGDYGNAAITKSSDGHIFASYSSRFFDTGHKYYTTVNKSTDTGASWSEIYTWATHGEPRKAENKLQLLPLGGGDILMIQHEWQNGVTFPVQSKVWDEAADMWDTTWTVIDAWRGNNNFDAPWSAVLDKGTGDIYLAGHTFVAAQYAGNAVKVYKFDGTDRAWATQSTLASDPSGQYTQVSLLLDDNTGDLYAVYGKNTSWISSDPNNVSLYYRKSSDGGLTWGDESSALNASVDDYRIVRGNFASDTRLFVTWSDIDDSILFGRTVINLDPEAYRLDNDGVTFLTGTSATLNGNLMRTNNVANTVRIAWGDSDGGTTVGAWDTIATVGGRPVGVFTNTITTVAGTHYYYRCYVEDVGGGNRVWAPLTAEFGTDGAPVVENGSATGVSATSATLGGTLISDGGEATTVRLYAGPFDGGTTAANWGVTNDLGVTAEGAFSGLVSGLTPGVTNYWRAFAINGSGSDWADSAAAVVSMGGVIYVNHAAGGANNGSSWGDAYTTVQAALSAATTNDEIYVAQGTYSPGGAAANTYTLGGKTVLGGFASGDTLAQRNPATKVTILNGAGVNYHVITGHGTLDGVWVQGGNANGGGGNNNGAGMWISGTSAGQLTLRQCTFTNNTANDAGAAIYAGYTPLAAITVEDCVFANNINNGVYGGAWFIEEVGADMTVTDTVFRDNRAAQRGAGIYARYDMGNFTFRNVTALRNRTQGGDANSGGAFLFVETGTRTDTSTFENCTIANNHAVNGCGAITFYNQTREVRFTDCTFESNYAAGNNYGGGAVHFRNLFDGAVFENCDFLNNATTPGNGYGGAVQLAGGYTYDGVRFYDCVFTNNTSDRGGGAVCLDRADVFGAANVFSNCTFLGNYNKEAGYSGGAIQIHDGASQFFDCTFATNRATAWGGAIQMEGNRITNTVPVSFLRCDFTKNAAFAGHGGAVAIRTGSGGDTTRAVKVWDCSFVGNTNSGGVGGAMYFEAGAGQFSNCMFNANATAANGGAVYMEGAYCQTATPVTFNACQFTNNIARANNGGAVYVGTGDSAATKVILVTNCTFYGNTALDEGGGLWTADGKSLTVVDTTFDWNRADLANNPGGAIRANDFDDGFTFRNCTFSRSQGVDGGAIYIDAQDGVQRVFSMVDCNFNTNSAWNTGGAMHIRDVAGLVSNCVFQGNITTNGEAGAVHYYYIPDAAGTDMTFADCRFLENSSQNNGGAMRLSNVGDIMIRNSTFTGNRVRNANYNGGAIYKDGTAKYLWIYGCTFTTNTATQEGGAFYIDGQAIVSNSVFTANQAGRRGGAIWRPNGALTVVESDFVRNETANQDGYAGGGAIAVEGGYDAILRNCLFAKNVSASTGDRGGGALRFDISGNKGYLENCTFYGNTAVYRGGAIRVGSGHLTVTNSIFYGNTCSGQPASADVSVSGGYNLTVGYSILDTSLVVNEGSPVAVYQTGVTNVNPQFVSVVGDDYHEKSTTGHWNGSGWTADATHSPAIDTGNPASAWGREPIPNGGRLNLGRYGNTPYASKSVAAIISNDPGATQIGSTTAKIRATLTMDGDPPTTVKFYWWNDLGSPTNIVNMGTQVQGAIVTNLLNTLTANSLYYYRAYATNASGEAWATNVVSFSTLGPPTIENLAAANVATNTASARGQLTGGGSGDVTVYWGLVDGGAESGGWAHGEPLSTQVQGSPFSAGLTGLAGGATYYYRCYVTNANGEAWAAATTNFTTDAAGQSTIDGTLRNASVQYNTGADTVFVNSNTGYTFYVSSENGGRVAYRKTTDGGSTWAAEFEITGNADWTQVVAWYDQWTPGDETGTKIHLAAYYNNGVHDLRYNSFNTAGDTPGSWVSVNTNNQNNWSDTWGNMVVAKGANGHLYTYVWGTFDIGSNQGMISRSTDGGATWTTIMDGYENGNSYTAQLLPLRDGDMLFIRHRYAGDGYVMPAQSKVFDVGTGTWDANWTDIDTWRFWTGVETAWGAAVDKYAGNVTLIANTFAATESQPFATVECYRFDGSSRTWSHPSTLATATNGTWGQARAMVDNNSGDLYGIYSYGPTWSSTLKTYYRKSTDGGATWGAEQGPVSSSAGSYWVVRGTLAAGERLYGTWYDCSANALYGRTIAVCAQQAYRIDNADGATLVGATTATLVGDLLKTNGLANSTYIAYGDNDGGNTTSAWDYVVGVGNTPAGTFSNAVSGLAAGSTYYYRCYVESAGGGDRAWAPVTTAFYTDGQPYVDNAGGASGVHSSDATLNGTLLSDGGAATTVRFYYGDNDGGTSAALWDATNAVGTATNGQSFSALVGGLTPGTQYFYRSFATNASGSDWANTAAAFTPGGGIKYVDATAGGANNGSSWADAYTTVHAALAAATTNDALWVAQGTYKPGALATSTYSLGGKAIYGGFPLGGSAWGGRNVATYPTVLSGDLGGGTFAYHVITGFGTLDGVTVRDGLANAGGANNQGGAIYISGGGVGALNLNQCTFTNNYATEFGGAIYIYNSSVPLTIDNCLFGGNLNQAAWQSWGGCVYVQDVPAPILVRNSTFVGNYSGHRGGVLAMQGQNDLVTFTNCVFRGNVSAASNNDHGGGVFFSDSGASVDSYNFVDCSFTNNTAASGAGGAIYLHGEANALNLIRCQIDGSQAAGPGGAVTTRAVNNGLTVTDCRFVNNSCTSSRGGAIYTWDDHAMPIVTVRNSVFTNNVAAGRGGAFSSQRAGGNFSPYVFSNCVFTANRVTTSEPGGAVSVHRGAVQFTDCTFTTNQAGSAGGAVWSAGEYITMANGPVAFTRCSFTNNRANNGYGGAVNIGGGTPTTMDVVVRDSTFTANYASHRGGAALFEAGRTFTAENCNFTGNWSGSDDWGAGALGLYDYDNGYTIDNCQFVQNGKGPTSGEGGAIMCGADSGSARPFTIYNSTFSTNYAMNAGGALRFSECAVTITNSHFWGNSCTNGGGGAIRGNGSGAAGLTVNDTDFRDNVCGRNGAGEHGGAIRLDDMAMAITDSVFLNNTAGNYEGGALYPGENNSRTITVTGSTFANNTARTHGGAIRLNACLIASNCTFTANTAQLNSGGAVRIWDSTNSVFTDCSFVNNAAATEGGGAIRSQNSTRLTVERCSFTGNRMTTDGVSGGAIKHDPGQRITLRDSTFSGNAATYDGGAVYMDNAGANKVEIRGCTFTSNTARRQAGAVHFRADGGEGYIVDTDFVSNSATNAAGEGYESAGALHIYNAPNVWMTNVLFAGNSVVNAQNAGGGALLVEIGGSRVQMDSVTFAGNTSGVGGGAIYVASGHLSVTNAIFWGNNTTAAETSDNIRLPGGYMLTLGYSDIDTGQIAGGGTVVDGGGLLNSDPLFVNAASDWHVKSTGGHWNGTGWTLDGVMSPAIDAGPPSWAYGNEAEENGDRVNLGRYGNTAEASRTSAPMRAITIGTSPAGLALVVDGTPSTGGLFNWADGSVHTAAVAVAVQSGGGGTQFVWQSWSDLGPQTNVVTVAADATLTAAFKTQMLWTVTANPPAGGMFTPASGTWHDLGASFQATAITNAGYAFQTWSGNLSGSDNPKTVTMSAPVTAVGNFGSAATYPQTVIMFK